MPRNGGNTSGRDKVGTSFAPKRVKTSTIMLGYADLRLVLSLVKAVRSAIEPQMPIRLHFHDTMELGLANALAGLERG